MSKHKGWNYTSQETKTRKPQNNRQFNQANTWTKEGKPGQYIYIFQTFQAWHQSEENKRGTQHTTHPKAYSSKYKQCELPNLTWIIMTRTTSHNLVSLKPTWGLSVNRRVFKGEKGFKKKISQQKQKVILIVLETSKCKKQNKILKDFFLIFRSAP